MTCLTKLGPPPSSTICNIVSAPPNQFDGYDNPNYVNCENCTDENPTGDLQDLGGLLDNFEDGFSTASDDVVFFANNEEVHIDYLVDLPIPQTQVQFPTCTVFAFFKRDPFAHPNRRPAFCGQ